MTLKAIAVAAWLLGAAGASGGTVADPAALGWMSGNWATAQGQAWTEERWAPPRGGVMLGTSLSGKGGKAGEFEFMRIAAEPDGVVTFWALPGGGKPVPFRLVAVSVNAAVFENPKHDFPTRIAYRRSGATMTATISGPGGAGQRSWTFSRSR